MFNERVRHMMASERLVTAPLQTSVQEAARLMAQAGSGVVLVMDGEALAGVFTSRDAVLRVLAEGRDADATPLSQVMTANPVTVEPDRPFGTALKLMQQHAIHHLPVVERGKPVGVVSARNALDPELEDFVCESVRREGFEPPDPSRH